MAIMINSFQVARDGAGLYVRAVGLANMKNAPILDAFLQAEMGPTPGTVCIDLSGCLGMDSTFMGLLVGTSAAIKLKAGRLVVVNPSEICHKLLDMLGISEVLPVVGACTAPALDFVELHAGSAVIGTIQRMEMIRRAHQALMGLNQANHAKFTAFITALDTDLAKLKAPIEGQSGESPLG